MMAASSISIGIARKWVRNRKIANGLKVDDREREHVVDEPETREPEVASVITHWIFHERFL